MIELINGDCIEKMKSIDSESIDLIVTDPPYLVNYKTGRRKDKTHKFCTTIENDDNPELISDYISECSRILKNDTAMYMFCSMDRVDFFKQELEKYFVIRNMIIWVKNNHTAGDLKSQFGKKYEILFLVNKGTREFNGKRITDIWKFDKVSSNNQLHQNEKPLDLITQCIEKHSDIGDTVFDGFMGSGTTGVACINTKRNFIGVELDDEYFEVAKERIDNAQHVYTSTNTVFDFGE